jgi:AcrR family transcriptional regulator
VARPRSALAHKKVLDAAVRLFALQGIEATSMDAIADESGVSKATIYKHWQDKDALMLEVVGYLHGLDEEAPSFDSGDLRDDLIAQLRYQPAADRQALREKITPHLMAYASRNRALGLMWRARIIEPRRAALIELIQRGQKRGEIVAGVDLEVAIALLFGPMLYRNVFLKNGGKGPKDLEVYVADAFLATFGTAKRKGR